MRNAVNLPGVSEEEYRRLRPYLELAERLGSFAAQLAGPSNRVRLTYSGEVGELNTVLLRNATLKGVLGRVLDEPANLVNAGTLAAERGLTVQETRVPSSAVQGSAMSSSGKPRPRLWNSRTSSRGWVGSSSTETNI